MARDHLEGNYISIDDLRHYPDKTLRPSPVPLISVLVSIITKYTTMSLEWAAVILPAILGPLLIFPIYSLCSLFSNGRLMGLTASLFSVLSAQYVNRTRIGFFDTDCLNVIFLFSIIYCFMKFGLEKKYRRYLYFILGVIFTSLFWWHWNFVRHIVLAMGFISCSTALIFFYRPPRNEAIKFGIFCCALIILIFYLTGMDNILFFINNSKEFTSVITQDIKGVFPATLIDVSEMRAPDLPNFVKNTSGNIFQILLSIIGFSVLIYKNKMKSLFLITPVILSIMTFFLGNRFLIFYAPISALGFGYLMNFLWEYPHPLSSLLKAIILIIVIACSSFMFHNNSISRYSPAIMNYLPGIKKINSLIHSESIIWSSWGSANSIMYYTRQRTISDAQFPKGRERHVYTCIPFAADNPRFSANFIQFFSTNGSAGTQTITKATNNDPIAGMAFIKLVLSTGPSTAKGIIQSKLLSGEVNPVPGITDVDDFLKFLYPKNSLRVYLLLQKNMTVNSSWFWFGSWDMQTKTGHKPTYFPLSIKEIQLDRILLSHGSIIISGNNIGMFAFNKPNNIKPLLLSKIDIKSATSLDSIPFAHNTDLCLELFTPDNFGAIMDTKMAISTFNKLFVLHQVNPKYFRLISENIPNFQIWEISGDHY